MKTKLIAYLLWFFFGGIGAHAFYLNKNKVGLINIGIQFIMSIAYILIMVVAMTASPDVASSAIVLPLILFGVIALFVMIRYINQAFNIPNWVKEANEQFEALEAIKEQRLIDALKAKA